MRDSQKKMYALDLRPGAFKISRNEGVNFAHIPVTDAIRTYPHSDMVFSTYCYADQRIVPGTERNGARIVSFDAILRYGKYPLAKALSEIMQICRKELLCEVEMEFAADMHDDGRLSLKLLQVRPISSYATEAELDFDKVCGSLSEKFVLSSRALGVGGQYLQIWEGISPLVISDRRRSRVATAAIFLGIRTRLSVRRRPSEMS